MRRFSDQKTNRHFDNALDKIKYALNSRQKEIIETITDTIRFPMLEADSKKENHLFAIQHAIIRKRILQITYINRQHEVSQREIEPIGLTFYGDQWHTIAYCWKREAYRDFIISSFQQVTSTALSFRKTDHITLDEYILELINSSGL